MTPRWGVRTASGPSRSETCSRRYEFKVGPRPSPTISISPPIESVGADAHIRPLFSACHFASPARPSPSETPKNHRKSPKIAKFALKFENFQKIFPFFRPKKAVNWCHRRWTCGGDFIHTQHLVVETVRTPQTVDMTGFVRVDEGVAKNRMKNEKQSKTA